ncbi:MAG: hypothetical protein NWF00_04445 [Candidatus Bathyarchaeota archaeon]|nr:hypothetical protein [Candidatus Bathyarchaeota archaeon]
MNTLIKAVGTGVVAAVATFFALVLSGLGTTGLADSQGNWVSLTTVNLGVNEFGLLMVLVVLVTVVAASYVFAVADKTNA